jgi:hypothetical protein
LDHVTVDRVQGAHVLLGAVRAGKLFTEEVNIEILEFHPMTANVHRMFDRTDLIVWPRKCLFPADSLEFEVDDIAVEWKIMGDDDALATEKLAQIGRQSSKQISRS